MPAWSAGYCIWNDDGKSVTLWMSSEGVLQPPFTAPTTEDELFIQMREGHEKGKTLHVVEMGGKKLEAHYQYMRTLPVVGEIFDSILTAGHPLPSFQVMHYAYFSKGYLLFITYEPVPDAHDIFKRFASVFEQTYTRFLDLQKAEAQAREAQIEVALERVRARTMAMQHSEELQDTSLILFAQLKELGEPAEQCTIGIIKESDGVVEISATLHGNKMHQTFRHKLDEPFVMTKMFKSWKDQQKTLVLEIKDEELKKYNQYRNELVGKETFPVKLLPGDRWIIHIAYFSKGMLALSTNEPRPAESLQLLERFAIVFEQTYIRFLDLQNAEAQAREAQIEAALERVRSRSMGMQKSAELTEVIQVVFEQFVHLNIKIGHTGFVMDYKARDDYDIWVADPLGGFPRK
ncbi:MAG: hypothetical protein IPP43_14510 [Chitinophagaceae bacterium]|nr:hypothetical protein [Chitinophagaceae bacterium]